MGLVLALLLNAPIRYFEGKGISRAFVSFIFLAVIFLGFPTILTIFLFKLWQELAALSAVHSLGQWASLFSEQIVHFFEGVPLFPGTLFPLNFVSFSDTLFRWAMAIPDLLLIWFLSAFSAFFFLRDKRDLTQYFKKQLPRTSRFSYFRIYRSTSGALWHLLRIQLLLTSLTTCISMIFFCLLQLPYALLLGLLVGFFDLIPVLGPGFIYLGLSVLQLWFGNLSTAIALGIGYLILVIVRQWGEPHLIGAPLGLHPLVALMGLYVGFRVWGLMGVLLAPVLMVFIKAFLGNN